MILAESFLSLAAFLPVEISLKNPMEKVQPIPTDVEQGSHHITKTLEPLAPF